MPRSNHWQPNATLESLKERAKFLAIIRDFFDSKGVLEVETPLLCSSAATDPYLKPISVFYSQSKYYLQTSPEFAMKRLLAAGSGPIYQICKAFREDEVGRLHNPEFTMLEWYRVGFDHHALMDEVEQLLLRVLEMPKAERLTYEEIFIKSININPHTASLDQVKQCARSHNIHLNSELMLQLTVDDWLDILMSHCIEPLLGFEAPVMVYDFPASKAALAKIRLENPPVAERFEVYVQGIELANGYHELTDPKLQQIRFEKDCEMRKKLGYAAIPIDDYLVAALEAGMPESSGVALGIDRLCMLKFKRKHIQEVIAFTTDRA